MLAYSRPHSAPRRLAIILLCFVGLVRARGATPDVRPVDRLQSEARGIYLLWSQGKTDADQLLDLPFVRGGQVVVQWADVAPSPERFDFKAIDAGLARFTARGRWATLQVNGNRKPAWLFDRVPHVPRPLSVQVQDRAGTLMFWHPEYQDAHARLLTALAAHLQASPHRPGLLGVRLNFNAIGTEHLAVPIELRASGRWQAPPGASLAGLPDFSPDVHDAYVDAVVARYERLFSSWTTVFVRNNLPASVLRRYDASLRSGRLALFHTSSEAEPRSTGTETQYGNFLDYSRPGLTVAYAEPWASAWGEHGGGPDPRWCSPAQWNYWTLLLNLHCGVSFIGEYYTNLHYATTGEHGRDRPVPPSAAGPQEFMAAYSWGGDYVGRHNRPAESPGAWVAFRANDRVKADNARVPDAGRTLRRFTGDYTFLAERIDGDGSTGVGPVGPADQRFGAFARRYTPGQTARVRLDPSFQASLVGPVTVRVIAMGDAPATVRIGTWSQPLPVSKERWRVTEFSVPAAAWTTSGQLVEILPGAAPLLLHLVEVRRGDAR